MPPKKTKAQLQAEENARAREEALRRALVGVPEEEQAKILKYIAAKGEREAELGRALLARELTEFHKEVTNEGERVKDLYKAFLAWQSGDYLAGQQAAVAAAANANVMGTSAGYELKLLKGISLPTSDILPLVVCKDIEITEKALDGTQLYTPPTKRFLKQYFEEQSERPQDNIIENEIVAGYVDQQTGNALVEGEASCSIHPDLLAENVVRDSYSDKENITDIPIYIVVISKAAGGHASLIVFYAGRLYSLGLGYSGGRKMEVRTRLYEAARQKIVKVIQDASLLDKVTPDLSKFVSDAFLYSPDFLIKPNEVSSKGIPYSFKVADIGVLKNKHLDRIQAILDAGKKTKVVAKGIFRDTTKTIWDTIFQLGHEGGNNLNFESFFIDIGTPYSIVSTRFSAKSAINCTSFLEYIFSERLACPAYQTFISEPTSCYSKAFKDPGQWVKQFARKFQRREAIGEDLLLKFSWDQGMANWIGTCTVNYCLRNRRWGGKSTRKAKKGNKTRRLRRH